MPAPPAPNRPMVLCLDTQSRIVQAGPALFISLAFAAAGIFRCRHCPATGNRNELLLAVFTLAAVLFVTGLARWTQHVLLFSDRVEHVTWFGLRRCVIRANDVAAYRALHSSIAFFDGSERRIGAIPRQFQREDLIESLLIEARIDLDVRDAQAMQAAADRIRAEARLAGEPDATPASLQKNGANLLLAALICLLIPGFFAQSASLSRAVDFGRLAGLAITGVAVASWYRLRRWAELEDALSSHRIAAIAGSGPFLNTYLSHTATTLDRALLYVWIALAALAAGIGIITFDAECRGRWANRVMTVFACAGYFVLVLPDLNVRLTRRPLPRSEAIVVSKQCVGRPQRVEYRRVGDAALVWGRVQWKRCERLNVGDLIQIEEGPGALGVRFRRIVDS